MKEVVESLLEKSRSERVFNCTIILQNAIRGFIHRQRFLKTRMKIITVQKIAKVRIIPSFYQVYIYIFIKR